MRTDELIRGLTADTRRDASPGQALAIAVPLGFALSIVLFAMMLRVRPDIGVMMMAPRLMLKFAVTGTLAVGSMLIVLALSRPGARVSAVPALLVPAAILVLGIIGEMAATAPASWLPGLVGHSARYCVVLIPVIAVPILGAMLLALRKGAPTRPMLAGAAAGLAAGGLAATLYALHCTDDSPLFVLAWYGIGIGVVALAGALAGRRMLAW